MHGAELFHNVGLGDVHAREVAGNVHDARSLSAFDLAIGESPGVAAILRTSEVCELSLHQAGFSENTGLLYAADLLIDTHYCRASELDCSGRRHTSGLVDKTDCRSDPDKSEQCGHGIIKPERSCYLAVMKQSSFGLKGLSFGLSRSLGWADPDKGLKCFGFRIFSRAFDHANSEYVICFYVRPREDRAY